MAPHPVDGVEFEGGEAELRVQVARLDASLGNVRAIPSLPNEDDGELEIVHEEGPALRGPEGPRPDADCHVVPKLVAAKGAPLRCIESRSERIWLSEVVSTLKGEGSEPDESIFLELRDYVVCEAATGQLASLLSVALGNARRHFIFGHLYRTDLGEDAKPLHATDKGFLATVRMEVKAWGIWWVDPKPILYLSVVDEEFGVDATIELHMAHAAYAADEARSQHARLRRLMDIADIVLFEFAEKNPGATLGEEEERAGEDPEEDIIVLGDEADADDDDEPKNSSLHRLLLERRGISLVELKKDTSACEFIAKQLEAEHMKVFFKTPLIRELLKRDQDGVPIPEDAPPEERRRKVDNSDLLPKAAEHPLVVTSRVKRTLLRCMMDLLGDQAYGQSLLIPKVVAETKNGKAVKVKPAGVGVPLESLKCKTTVYQAVRLFYANGNNIKINNGDFVRTLDQDTLQYLKVMRMWQTEAGAWKVHALALRSMDSTVLGICGLPSELVYTAQCTTIKLHYVEGLVDVGVEAPPDFGAWQAEGLAQTPLPSDAGAPARFRLRFRYRDDADDLSFAYLSPEERFDLSRRTLGPMTCRSCQDVADEAEAQTAALDDAGAVRLCGEAWALGQCAFLVPDAVALRHPADRSNSEEKNRVKEAVAKFLDHKDPDPKFPEARHYQKQLERGEFKRNFIEPYMIVRLRRVLCDKAGKPAVLIIQPFYRATDIDFGSDEANADKGGFRKVYYADEEVPIGVDRWAASFQGRCYVGGFDSEKKGQTWVTQGPSRFYCDTRYSVSESMDGSWSGQLGPLGALEVAGLAPGMDGAPEFPPVAGQTAEEQLCSLEMFCGGGGSSTGLHQAGIRTKMAVDMDREAVETMRRNNPDADVRQIDVNFFLQSSMDGCDGFPRTGDFDVIFGGPPCQGFSAMNRSPNTANSKKKNTCVTTQCGAYDYFRPAYTCLENVHGLLNMKEDVFSGVEGKKTSVCNVIIAVMLDLGFQVRAFQLNAGAYGVPQCRNRVFIVGAAPGHFLPDIPQPLYASQLAPVVVSGLASRPSTSCASAKVRNGWSAPLPELTVNDAISDLPPTSDGVALRRSGYGSAPKTWYQIQMRGSLTEVTAHESRALSALDRVRVKLIPASSPSLPEPDWRLLPNAPLLFNGTELAVLPYEQDGPDPHMYRFVCPTCPKDYHIKVKGRAKPFWKCNLPQDTLIPAGLTHKSKNNSWKDCYGRVSKHLWFRTITTGDSLNQQAGRILHPEQHRILTTRELARAQGFPDSWMPEGRISARTRQIGNAVPPPLTKAIGRQIRLAHVRKGAPPSPEDDEIMLL